MMIAEIEKVKPVGRLVVDIEKIIGGQVDYDFLARHAKLIIDTRNACRGLASRNIVRA